MKSIPGKIKRDMGGHGWIVLMLMRMEVMKISVMVMVREVTNMTMMMGVEVIKINLDSNMSSGGGVQENQ